MPLNRRTLAAITARTLNLPQALTHRVIDTVIDLCIDELIAGGAIHIDNFATLTTHTRSHRNPQTNATETHTRIRVQFAKKLRNQIQPPAPQKPKARKRRTPTRNTPPDPP